jgi:hypothetical protein
MQGLGVGQKLTPTDQQSVRIWSRGFLYLLLAATVASPSAGQSVQTPAGAAGFCFHGSGVNLPIGRFLLIRKGDQFGALRITQIRPETQSKPTAGEWLGSVEYESYFIVKPFDSFSNVANRKHSGELRFGRMKGFGFHYSWQSGNQEAVVGPWKFRFFNQDGMFMTAVDFWNGVDHDSGLEFAPTDITEANRLNPRERELHWYTYDANRDIPCPVEAISKPSPSTIPDTHD